MSNYNTSYVVAQLDINDFQFYFILFVLFCLTSLKWCP